MFSNVYNLYISDYERYMGRSKGVKPILRALFGRDNLIKFTFWLRFASKPNPIRYIAKHKHRRMMQKYGLQIPYNTQIGYGFYIGHGVGIVINCGTKIGNNCNVSQFLTIGTNTNNPATIGDNVYIGPNVCIVEGVHIGNNVTIGAGSVVTKDIPDNATVAGVPAKVLNYNNPGRFIGNRYEPSIITNSK